MKLKLLLSSALAFLFIMLIINGCSNSNYDVGYTQTPTRTTSQSTIYLLPISSEEPLTEEPLTEVQEQKAIFLSEEEKKVLENDRFLNTFIGSRCRGVAYQFFRAYVLADIEAAKSLMENPIDNDIDYFSCFPTTKRSLDNVDWLILKLFGYSSSLEEGVVFEAEVTFEFNVLPEDSFSYLGIGMIYKDDEWKVTSFGLEK